MQLDACMYDALALRVPNHWVATHGPPKTDFSAVRHADSTVDVWAVRHCPMAKHGVAWRSMTV